MIKQIQLRGISRTPSDRMTSDGGCAESLNMEIDTNELAPMLPPEDITEGELPGFGDLAYEIVYIHKTNQYTNYILWDNIGHKLGMWDMEDEGMKDFLDLAADEELGDITSIGNTLVISTSMNLYYILYKSDGYLFLGSKIPFPIVEFKSVIPTIDGISHPPTSEGWLPAYVNLLAEPYPAVTNESLIAAISEFAENERRIYKNMGYLARPIFCRYAVELYDGSLISSIPYLMGVDSIPITAHYKISAEGTTEYVTGPNNIPNLSNYYESLHINSIPYSIQVKILSDLNEIKEEWGDIIKKISFYITPEFNTEIYNLDEYTIEKIYSSNFSCTREVHQSASGASYRWNIVNKTEVDIKLDNPNYNSEQLNRILNASLFYKVDEIDLTDLKKKHEYTEGKILDLSEYITNSTELITDGNLLKNDDMRHVSYLPQNLSSYNNRILMSGVKEVLDSGSPLFPATKSSEGGFSSLYVLKFYIKGASDLTVMARSLDNNPYFLWEDEDYYDRPLGLLFYPNPQCYKVEIEYHYSSINSPGFIKHGFIEMNEHPSLDCAYAYTDIEKFLDELLNVVAMPTLNSEENKVIDVRNKLFLSEIDNPFVFPIENRYYFTDAILGIASVTKALSTGQFGQYPLYVFTEGGIWVMEIGNTGNLTSSKPLSREVCTSPKSITMIDQAIIFLTKKGLMLMQGSDITCISPNMNGRHYAIDTDLRELLTGTVWESLIDVLEDDTHFMDFMANAQIVYDYTGKRLICFSEGEPYFQYVYKLDSDTWHKSALVSGGYTIKHVLNSYPDAIINAFNENDESRLINLSTVLDVNEDNGTELKGVVITRPFDLDNPDIRKVIKQLKIRGQYNKGDVKYILLSSDDDIHWHVETSLMRHSSKLFRLVILTNFSPTERLSYVDVDFETRFTNKLR